jgi:hypothetical protein
VKTTYREVRVVVDLEPGECVITPPHRQRRAAIERVIAKRSTEPGSVLVVESATGHFLKADGSVGGQSYTGWSSALLDTLPGEVRRFLKRVLDETAMGTGQATRRELLTRLTQQSQTESTGGCE